jgi:hypothetical protein
VVHLLEALSPNARVATAILPFVLALVLRVLLGRNKMTRTLISIGTMWFVMNVLLAPYSSRMRADLQRLEYVIH